MGASEGSVPRRGKTGYAFVIFSMEGPFTDLTVTASWAASAIGFMILGPPVVAHVYALQAYRHIV